MTSKKSGGNVFTPYVSNFSYTASGGISQMRLGNGKWETAKFNSRLQVTELGLRSSSADASIWKVNYEYGELQGNGIVDTAKNTGNIAKLTLTIPGASFVQAYQYDSLYRLIDAAETTGATTNWIQHFGYDRYGNRTSFNQTIVNQQTTTTPTVDPNTNRFTSQDFVYDKNGNVTTDRDSITNATRTFVFNGDNKQTEVKNASGEPIGRYYYDGEGKRVKKKVYDPSAPSVVTEETVFVYSAGKLVAEYSTQLSQTPSINYTTTDHLGSPRIITDELGQVKARRDFMPFGEELFVNVGARSEALKYGANADSVRQKFTGYQKDSETSLDFAEARMYENRYARFTAVDPLLASGKSASPQSFNRYVYVTNNPLLLTDPAGLDPWWKQRIGDTNRYNYVESKNRPDGNGWEEVNFSNNWYTTVGEWNDTGRTAYLYQGGGQDMGARYQRVQDLANFFNPYSASDPKQLAARDPQVRAAAADVIGGITGAGINGVTATYNLGAYGVNYFSGSQRLPYAWEYTPETGGQKLFYYGTNALFLAEGGISVAKGLASGINTIRSGGLSFRAYRAAQGPSEILGTVDVTTRSGRQIPYAIRTELSHMFISQARQRTYNLPNWLVNNRINVWKLNTIQHALIDSSRFRTLPVGLKPQAGWTKTYNFFTRSF